MDFGLTEEQTELAGLTRKILAEREAPWGDLAAAGVLAAGLPVSLGGAGLGLLEQCSVLIELGRAACDVPYLASVVLGAGAVGAFGADAQQEQWAGPAGRGGGRWVLTGLKTAGDAAPEADLFLVPCTGPDGVLVFLVAPSDAGVSVEPQRLTDFASAGRVVLDGCVLDDDRVLAGNGHGDGV